VLEEASSLDALPERDPVVVRLSGRDIVLVRRGEQVFALKNVCPHQTQSFLHGHTYSRLLSDHPGRVAVSDEPVLACPWHHWEFSLRTGVCMVDAAFRVRTYRVVLEGGKVFVDVHAKSADAL
jgi:nitrite reductase (NADH) small subunit